MLVCSLCKSNDKDKNKTGGVDMVLADWIILGVVLACAVIGILFGFGKTLKFFTSHIFGIIISIVVCYFIYGVVISWGITQDLIAKLDESLLSGNGFTQFLYNIHIETIVVAIVLFVIVQLLRILIVHMIKDFSEIDNTVFKVINKTLGLIFMLALATMVLLIVFQIAAWIGGSTSQGFYDDLQGSFFRLDKLYLNNPLNAVIELFSK
jgi:uncharacterized membrane protein required for colicin V production